MSEEKKEKEPSDLQLKLADIMGNIYKPGTTTHFDKTMSTNQVFNQLQQLYPADSYDPHDIFDLLKELEYKYDYIGGELEWLILVK